jgi:hypothetical protein
MYGPLIINSVFTEHEPNDGTIQPFEGWASREPAAKVSAAHSCIPSTATKRLSGTAANIDGNWSYFDIRFIVLRYDIR